MSNPRPTVTDPNLAIQRAYKYTNHGQYMLGTGDSNYSGGQSDCAGYAINYCWGIKRHRPGFNHGPWATIEDDLNCNSALEDADHNQELFFHPPFPARGDLLAYPTIYIRGHHPWIGHVCIITNVPSGFVPAPGNFHRLDVIQCRGPNGARPGVVCSDGSVWDHHDASWGHELDGTPTPQRCSRVIRVKP